MRLADLVARRVGVLARGSRWARISMPGVQKPHCSPCFSQNASWSGWSSSPSARAPSTVVISAPSAWTASMMQERTVSPSRARCRCRRRRARSRCGCRCRPRSSRRKSTSSQPRLDRELVAAAVDGEADRRCAGPCVTALPRAGRRRRARRRARCRASSRRYSALAWTSPRAGRSRRRPRGGLVGAAGVGRAAASAVLGRRGAHRGRADAAAGPSRTRRDSRRRPSSVTDAGHARRAAKSP